MYNKLKVVTIIGLALALAAAGTAANPDTLTDPYISLALQGDLRSARELFDETGENGTPSSDNGLAARFRSRFVDQNEMLSPDTGDAFVNSVVRVYREYWVRTLTRRHTVEEGAHFLETALLDLLRQSGETVQPHPASGAFDRVGAVLRDKGFHYLEAEAPPLRDLFLWKSEENKRYMVRLTDRTQAVRVTFMKEIYSMGWKEFATLGLVSTTGWVEGTNLYCVSQAYDRSSEEFRVSYLKHESRHLADFERFPGLPSSELEYRAKLTELAFASTTLRGLLEDFTSKSDPNPGAPHTFANHRVSRAMYLALYGKPMPGSGSPWLNVKVSAANQAARKLLRQNTGMLIDQGGLKAPH